MCTIASMYHGNQWDTDPGSISLDFIIEVYDRFNVCFSPLQGCMLAQDIRDRERGGRARIGVVEGDREEASSELMKLMVSVLGQRTGTLRDAVPDDTPDQFQTTNVKLYLYVLLLFQ